MFHLENKREEGDRERERERREGNPGIEDLKFDEKRRGKFTKIKNNLWLHFFEAR